MLKSFVPARSKVLSPPPAIIRTARSLRGWAFDGAIAHQVNGFLRVEIRFAWRGAGGIPIQPFRAAVAGEYRISRYNRSVINSRGMLILHLLHED